MGCDGAIDSQEHDGTRRAPALPRLTTTVLVVGVDPFDASAVDTAALSEAEQRRLAAFSNAHLARRFVGQRTALRRILGGVLNVAPAEVAIRRKCYLCGHPTHGKPYLAGREFEFSVAHSADRLAVAISSRPVGIDIEYLGARPSQRQRLVRAMRHQADPEAATEMHALQLWTAKEAASKVSGSGLVKAPPRALLVTPETAWSGAWRRFVCTSDLLPDADIGGEWTQCSPGVVVAVAAAIDGERPKVRALHVPARSLATGAWR
jgi:phosphopantetheinyl transferase